MTAGSARTWPAPVGTALGEFYRAHSRHRRICTSLVAAAATPDSPPRALQPLLSDLAADFQRLDVAEQLLFGLLRQRAEPEDDIARVLGILAADYDASRATMCELGAALQSPRGARVERAAIAEMVERLVARKLRTIALENAVVLPIARLRLGVDDLAQLAACLDPQQPAASNTPA